MRIRRYLAISILVGVVSAGAGIGGYAAYASVATSGTTFVEGGAITHVSVRRMSGSTGVAGGTPLRRLPTGIVRLQGAGLLLIRFSGNSRCEGPSECLMKIFVDGVEARPVASDPVFDVGSTNLPLIGAPRSIDRTIRVGTGTHVVQVMIGTGAGTTFLLSNWSLIVQRAEL